MTWDDLEAVGLGRLRLDVDKMYDMTPREFANALRGYTEQEQFYQREAWERMRMQTVALLQVHVKKGRQLRPTDVMKFDWDETKYKGLKQSYDEQHTQELVKKWGMEGKVLHAGGK